MPIDWPRRCACPRWRFARTASSPRSYPLRAAATGCRIDSKPPPMPGYSVPSARQPRRGRRGPAKLFLQLLLPVEHAALGGPFLGLRHIAGLLIDARDVGVGEDLVRRKLHDPLGGCHRLV